ncbi:hypothetical protein K437DRAFT_153523 [Tilletiaria anomala UBC 951]|uniref:Uncharacterized protein n=1 Tax=Tilletiaria anomala (strain ATCC 24038 / CBS 436.72 / UBC 951) TaxID=1037660 RepID=A0A066VSU5_TILAU|nr:uncharacterized protein K437DRAFT_153523 [Tilletiaria anomala UBC 951]KDN43328.1 hypothetical protein K437DRAFT_153523 [Tilletiaria anomala UBC 951]
MENASIAYRNSCTVSQNLKGAYRNHRISFDHLREMGSTAYFMRDKALQYTKSNERGFKDHFVRYDCTMTYHIWNIRIKQLIRSRHVKLIDTPGRPVRTDEKEHATVDCESTTSDAPEAAVLEHMLGEPDEEKGQRLAQQQARTQ